MAELSRAVKLTLLSLFILASISVTVTGYGGMVGGKTEVKDVKSNVEVQELGKFSVEEFKRRQRRSHGGSNGSSSSGYRDLKFSQVVEAQKQVVNGIKYYLRIEAVNGGEIKVFDSVVVVKPWVHSRELLNFAPSKLLRI